MVNSFAEHHVFRVSRSCRFACIVAQTSLQETCRSGRPPSCLGGCLGQVCGNENFEAAPGRIVRRRQRTCGMANNLSRATLKQHLAQSVVPDIVDLGVEPGPSVTKGPHCGAPQAAKVRPDYARLFVRAGTGIVGSPRAECSSIWHKVVLASRV